VNKNKKKKSGVNIDVLECKIDDWDWIQMTAKNSDGETVGTACVYYLGKPDRSPEFCNVYVAENYRQIGIGKALLKKARKLAFDVTRKPLNLHCKFMSFAYGWYINEGFVRIGEPVDDEIYLVDFCFHE
jgi:GNAT superfamily N-acetyltransferase